MSDAIPESGSNELKHQEDEEVKDRVLTVEEDDDEGDLIDDDQDSPKALSSQPASYQKKSKDNVERVSMQILRTSNLGSPKSNTVFNAQAPQVLEATFNRQTPQPMRQLSFTGKYDDNPHHQSEIKHHRIHSMNNVGDGPYLSSKQLNRTSHFYSGDVEEEEAIRGGKDHLRE